MSGLSKLLGIGLVGGLAFLVGIKSVQDKLIYFPDKNPLYDSQFKKRNIILSDKTVLNIGSLLQDNSRQAPTIIFFHGNAGNMDYNFGFAQHLFHNLGCNIYVPDYRGYGFSSGKPSEAGLKIDGYEVIKYVHSVPDIDNSKIFVYGQSVGGAVAINSVIRNHGKVRGLILENSFLSIPDIVDSLYPFLGIFKNFVLNNKWDNKRDIKKVNIPILFISGDSDEIVPSNHMKQLYRLAETPNKQWLSVRRGQHNNTWYYGGPEYIDKLKKFISSLTQHILQQ